MSVEQAIAQSKVMVGDAVEFDGLSVSPEMEKDLLVAPMPSMF